MKRLFIAFALTIAMQAAWAATRWNEEGAWYGVNYTLPFAHAWRATEGMDRKAIADYDMAHWKRLGFNAFRIHLWDVEISDGTGKLLENEHLDLLDYIIAQAAKNGINVVITAQTNFGNGYPERNTDPNGAYSYKYSKGEMHLVPSAQDAQERYLTMLVRHENPYNGRSWSDDPAILAIEVNNEPQHTGTQQQVTDYIDRMTQALRKAGWHKAVLYNVSHNTPLVAAYYAEDIDGTTYQWYPIGLVAGHTRKGNFLPALDQYTIPWLDKVSRPDLSKIVYEFDPADNIATYLYPSVVRTLRREGFSWITQFAYDPTPIADVNTEYQTHWLNLLYTPGKAIGMMVAGEAMRQIPMGTDYGKYPQDTVFGPFTVSARRDLSMLNDGKKYIHTNSTDVAPIDVNQLELIAGVGSSPVVTYDGTGAYFIEKGEDGRWMVEVMPDVVYLEDPFATPSPQRRVARLVSGPRTMHIHMPQFDTLMVVTPQLPPFVKSDDSPALGHKPVDYALRGSRMTLCADVLGQPDSVIVYPGSINFWRDHNRLYPMRPAGHTAWEANDIEPGDYWITAFYGDEAVTWPGGIDGTPLDWTFNRQVTPPYSVTLLEPGAEAVTLFEAGKGELELSTVPGTWNAVQFSARRDARSASDVITLTHNPHAGDTPVECYIMTVHVAPVVKGAAVDNAYNALELNIAGAEGVGRLLVSLVNGDGFTYGAFVEPREGTATVDLAELVLHPTQISPEPFPIFLDREFIPDALTVTPLAADDILDLVIVAWPSTSGTPVTLSLRSASLLK